MVLGAGAGKTRCCGAVARSFAWIAIRQDVPISGKERPIGGPRMKSDHLQVGHMEHANQISWATIISAHRYGLWVTQWHRPQWQKSAAAGWWFMYQIDEYRLPRLVKYNRLYCHALPAEQLCGRRVKVGGISLYFSMASSTWQ